MRKNYIYFFELYIYILFIQRRFKKLIDVWIMNIYEKNIYIIEFNLLLGINNNNKYLLDIYPTADVS